MNHINTEENKEETPTDLAPYWLTIEDFGFPTGKGLYVYYTVSKSIERNWLVTVTVVDKTNFLFTRHDSAFQTCYKPGFNTDYGGMKQGRLLARGWLREKLASDLWAIAAISLPALD